MGNRVLVTGAGGYIGSHVVTALCNLGAEVIALDRATLGIDPRATALNMDIFSGSKNIFNELGRPDTVLHMAWKDGFVHNADSHMELLSDHYIFTRNLMDGGLKHFAAMGTMHEVGYYEGMVDENTPCNPLTKYGIAKNALRKATLMLGKEYGCCTQWLRAYYIYGDDSRNHSVFTKLTEAEKAGQEHFPFNSGKNKYDFTEVGELAQQIAMSVLQTEVDGVINCCTGNPVSLQDKVEAFIKEHGYSIRLDYGAFPDRPYDSPAIWGDASKIQEITSNMVNSK